MTPNQLRATLAHEWRIRQEGRSRRLTSRIDSLGSCALYLRTGGGHELVQATGVRTELPFIVSWKLVTITAERAKELKDLLESERVGELGLRYRVTPLCRLAQDEESRVRGGEAGSGRGLELISRP